MQREPLVIHQYEAGQDLDLELLVWWRDLVALGELTEMFGTGAQCLSGFFDLMAKPTTVLLYTMNADGSHWTRAAWFVPFLNGGAWSFWLHPDVRHHRASLAFMVRSLQTGFTHWPLIMGISTNHVTAGMANRFGFSIVGTFPELLEDGRPCYVSYLSKADFAKHIADRKWGSLAYGQSSR